MKHSRNYSIENMANVEHFVKFDILNLRLNNIVLETVLGGGDCFICSTTLSNIFYLNQIFENISVLFVANDDVIKINLEKFVNES